jgi:ABC-type nitrate/sulfonate/bicarbonate transport system ATPase subunit
MKIKKEVHYKIKEFEDEELDLSQSVFGLVPQAVYFNFDCDLDIDTEKNKLIYVYGLSGEGKSILKDVLAEQLATEMYVIDYDSYGSGHFFGRKISEIFDLRKDKDFLISLFSAFGLFEMRNIFSRFEELSQGQQKRIRYMYLIYEAYKHCDVSNSVLLIDEFLTFVDSLSAKVFAQGIRKFMKKHMPHTILFAFGCNDNILGYWEDLIISLQNGKVVNVEEVSDGEREGSGNTSD